MTSPDGPFRVQRAALAAGAALDAAFGAAMLLVPGQASRLLRVEVPQEPVWFNLAGVLLLLVAGLYLVARCDARVAHAAGWVAGAGRLLGSLVLARHAAAGGTDALAFGVTAVADGSLGVVHLAAAYAAFRARRLGAA